MGAEFSSRSPETSARRLLALISQMAKSNSLKPEIYFPVPYSARLRLDAANPMNSGNYKDLPELSER